MDTYLALVTTALIVASIAWLLVRTIRADRPIRPPNPLRTWQDEQVEWRRIGIS
jgi:hypothetical protein